MTERHIGSGGGPGPLPPCGGELERGQCPGFPVTPATFRAEVDAWAARIGVTPAEVRIRPMKRKWASCSTAGRLTFNVELLTQPTPFRAEAIAHELLHLKVPNHGRLFKSLLHTYLTSSE